MSSSTDCCPCMGYRLEITRQPITPKLTRSERRSWKLHRELARHLTRSTSHNGNPTIERNLRAIAVRRPPASRT